MSGRKFAMLDRAMGVASTSTEKRKHGCVIALGSRVLSVGVNSRRNHPAVCSDPGTQASYHAEIAALRALHTTVDYSRLTLYSARMGKDGEWLMAKPCEACALAIEMLGIKDVRWTEG